MNTEDEITVWIQELADSQRENTSKIWNRYYQQLVAVARKKLRSMPRRHLDEEDIATDALNSLFAGIEAGRFPDLNDREDLWKLLLTITARKAGKAIRSNLTEKRGGGQIRGESIFANPDQSHVGLANILGPEPSPELAEDITQQCRDLLSRLDDPVLETIAVKKLEGFSNEEIATALEVATRTVERKLKRIRALWSDAGMEPGG